MDMALSQLMKFRFSHGVENQVLSRIKGESKIIKSSRKTRSVYLCPVCYEKVLSPAIEVLLEIQGKKRVGGGIKELLSDELTPEALYSMLVKYGWVQADETEGHASRSLPDELVEVECADGSKEFVDRDELEAAAAVFDGVNND
jgi:hypothetical protein